tara:strand:+ start:1424 stop:1678 length:255 start_codon:yes stop_codon:yes gene_type:complete
MDLTGSIIVFVIIWWIVFFAVLPFGVKSNDKPFSEKIEGVDPGAPKNPNIAKKFLYTTIITTIIFLIIYYMVMEDYLNLRKLLI